MMEAGYACVTACAHLQMEMDGTRASDLPPYARGLHTNDDPVHASATA